MWVLCWTSLCYDLRLQNLANDAFPRDIELVDHRIMLSAVTKGFRHLLTWPFSRTELLQTCVQIRINLKVMRDWSQAFCKIIIEASSASKSYRFGSIGSLNISTMKYRIRTILPEASRESRTTQNESLAVVSFMS